MTPEFADLFETVRIVLYHKQATSARTLFLRHADGSVCAPAPLPPLATVLAEDESPVKSSTRRSAPRLPRSGLVPALRIAARCHRNRHRVQGPNRHTRPGTHRLSRPLQGHRPAPRRICSDGRPVLRPHRIPRHGPARTGTAAAGLCRHSRGMNPEFGRTASINNDRYRIAKSVASTFCSGTPWRFRQWCRLYQCH